MGIEKNQDKTTTDLTWFRPKVEMLLSSYKRILMVSKAQVLSANKPDLRDIMTLQASGVPETEQNVFRSPQHIKTNK